PSADSAIPPLSLHDALPISQVRQEVLADKLQKMFGDAVRDNNLRVAGYPRFETRSGEDSDRLEYTATFEIYPEVKLGDLAEATIDRKSTRLNSSHVKISYAV